MINKIRPSNGQKIDINVIRKFGDTNRFKKMVLIIIASQMKSKDIDEIANLFRILNTKNNGILSK